MDDADEIRHNFVIGAEIHRALDIGRVTAGACDILAEYEIDAVGRVFVVVERVVDDTVARCGGDRCTIGELGPNRQRGFAVGEAADLTAGCPLASVAWPTWSS